MKTTIKLFLIAAASLVAADLYSLSDGAFNITGTPGEGDCSGCHFSAVNADPKGSMRIEIDSSNGYYEPGKTYAVKVTLAYPGKTRFGFALNNRAYGFIASTGVGTYSADTSNGVWNKGDHVAHKKSGIDRPNQRIWSFRWTAPDTAVGEITFYTAGVVANADDDNTGDQVYKTTLTLRRAGTTGLSAAEAKSEKVEVFPVPATTTVWFKHLKPEQLEEAALINSAGVQVREYKHTDFTTADSEYTRLFLGDGLAAGTYMLRMKYEMKVVTARIFIL